MRSSGFSNELRTVTVDGIGDVVATIEHLHRSDGSVEISTLKGASRLSPGAPLTEAEMRVVAVSLGDVFY